jgi:hypothetical protein
MRLPWNKRDQQMKNGMDKANRDERAEVDRRLKYLEAQVKVLKERAKLRMKGDA